MSLAISDIRVVRLDITSLCIPKFVVLRYVVTAKIPRLRSRSLTTVPVSKTPVLSTVLEPRAVRLVTAVVLIPGQYSFTTRTSILHTHLQSFNY